MALSKEWQDAMIRDLYFTVLHRLNIYRIHRTVRFNGVEYTKPGAYTKIVVNI